MKNCIDIMCMTKVHLPPMNKFACKLHGYIVYLQSKLSMLKFTIPVMYTKNMLQE